MAFDSVGLGISLAAYALSLSVHESAHAWTALRLGDTTGAAMGRISLNPMRHVDLFGTIILPLVLWFSSDGRFMFGYAKPVPYNPFALKNPHLGSAAIAAAGPISNLVLAVIAALVLRAAVGAGAMPDSIGWRLFSTLVWLNLVLALFNLLPVPPLDGGTVLAGLLPRRLGMAFDALRPYGFLVLILLIVTRLHWVVLMPPLIALADLMQTIAGGPIG